MRIHGYFHAFLNGDYEGDVKTVQRFPNSRYLIGQLLPHLRTRSISVWFQVAFNP